ncbi:MAG: hypothetical protein K0R93_2551 [Anaerosolibacter sp.]|jgi:hypothetical protein|nr:hypothetical protein [Anaerosolibacter sp.]
MTKVMRHSKRYIRFTKKACSYFEAQALNILADQQMFTECNAPYLYNAMKGGATLQG